MPSWDLFQRTHHNPSGVNTVGEALKSQSDQIMEYTWNSDLQQRIAYQFDMYHDPDPRWLKDMEPNDDMIPLDIKYMRHTSQTLAKDVVSYHIQMRPSQRMNVPYYQDYIAMYKSEWPLGEYLLVPDNKGVYNRWLIVAKADVNDPQFSTYEILPCDYTFQYIIDGHKMEVASVLRSQNSYNSGEHKCPYGW